MLLSGSISALGAWSATSGDGGAIAMNTVDYTTDDPIWVCDSVSELVDFHFLES